MDGDFPWIFYYVCMEYCNVWNVNISYVGMHECWMLYRLNAKSAWKRHFHGQKASG